MRADALVVLGCRFGLDGTPSAAAGRRAKRAAEAYRLGVAPRIVCSGGRRWGTAVEAVAMRDVLARLGVPPDRVVLELASLTTAENARFTAELLLGAGLARVAIVSCDWHVERAARSFSVYGLQVTTLPAPTPPSTAWARARRTLHEAVSSRLDARTWPAAARPALWSSGSR